MTGRRQFIQTLAGASVVRVPARAAPRERPPNILVLMSDEHNHRVAGCYGNRLARTPNIDGLAERGITFDHAYCNSPLCVPSRLSFTAGKYIHRTGAWGNNCWLPSAGYPSISRVMNEAGYESFLCGKQHYDAARRYGFLEIGGNHNRHFKSGREVRRAAGDMAVNVAAGEQRFREFHPGDTSSTLDHDRRVSAGAIEFLSRRGRREKPFFLFVGYLAPHFPIIVPERYWEPYKGKVSMPEIPEGFLESMPLNYQHLRRGFGLLDVPEETVRRGRELYYGLTQWVDEEIGKVLRALEKSPAADDTVIIYTSDHGENMGEHGLWWKNCMYEQAAHVPLVINWPRRWNGGQRRAGGCSLVDVVQTIAGLGGARAPDDWNGDSMVQWLDDGTARWKDVAVSQYYAHNIASGFAMLRSGSWKYVYHSAADAAHPSQRELYDLETDPQEFRNLAGKPEQQERAAAMHSALLKELGEHPDETEQRCRAQITTGYGRSRPPA